MLELLAQSERDQALSEGYWGLVLILLIGLAGVLLFVVLFLSRRWARRHLRAIEQDKAQRRAARSAERVDAWRAGSDRYIDHDKLPDDPDADGEPDYGETDDDDDDRFDDADDPMDDDDPPPGWDEGPEQRDPYGLFDDKPYREPEDDEDDEDDEGWDDDDDDDDDEDDGRR